MNGNEIRVKPGQVVFFKTNGSWWDFFIMLVSRNYTHVGYAISETQVIEANINGVQITPICDCLDVSVASIPGITQSQITRGIKWGFKHLGEPYSVPQALYAGVLSLIGLKYVADYIDKRWFCSEFIVSLLRHGCDVQILPGMPATTVLPDDLAFALDPQEV